MAIFAKNIVIKEKPADPVVPVNYIIDQTINAGNITVSKLINESEDKMYGEAAAIRPLIKEPIVNSISENHVSVEITKKYDDALFKHKTPRRSQYIRDMLTVE
jgi:hypothetical protein